ncbi:MAG: hypothetical protein JSW47_09715 [Phycisphaerales bacterium]|nr:MAG: hypothetical protein JSW47_09715 [Phycisphaerales bacterium]
MKKHGKFQMKEVMLLVFAFTGLSDLGIEAAQAPAEIPRRSWDHFTFMRHNVIRHGPESLDTLNYTLVAAHVMARGFQLRDVRTAGMEIMGDALCVTGGKYYALRHGHTLISVDMTGGGLREIASNIAASAYESGRLYGLVRAEEDNLRLRIFDLPSEAYREIGPLPRASPFIRGVAVSPDQKWFAYFGDDTQGERISGRNYPLYVVDLDTGIVRRVGQPIHFEEAAISSVAMGNPPFARLDERTILAIRTQPDQTRPNTMSTLLSEAVNWITAVDIQTGEQRDVARIPGMARNIVPWLVPPAGNLPPILHARQDYVVDVEGDRLVGFPSKGIQVGRFRLGRKAWLTPQSKWRAERIYHGDRLVWLGKDHEDLVISPDGKRVIWSERSEKLSCRIFYYDVETEKVRAVSGDVSKSPRIWFTDEHVRPRERPAAIPRGFQKLPQDRL